MKNIVYILVALVFFSSCEDFLDTESYTKKTTSNFPKTLDDAEQMIAGIYATQILAASSVEQTYYYAAELASDDRFGGGGENDKKMQAYDKLMANEVNFMENFWRYRYQGIFRANMGLETIDNCEGFTSEEQKNQMKGEIYFLRGYFYHELAEAFGNVPLVLATAPENLPKAETDELYAQIAYDLKTAIEILPAKSFTSIESGHATKWDAQALMARVFLFYTGFYGKDALPLGDAEGNVSGSVTKDQVIGWLEDCINNSGHKLVDDYRSLWPYSNEWTANDYPFVESARWAGDGHSNPEKMFSIKYSAMAQWVNTQHAYSNGYALHFSLRANNGSESTFPLGVGWGAGPVNTIIWNEWKQAEPNDMRREASIADVMAECEDYQFGQDMQMEETGYWSKKVMNIQAYDDGVLHRSFGSIAWKSKDDVALNNPTDLPLIRFADVLLMHSELKQDAGGINQVRARAGLEPIGAYSLEALKKERRFELAFEGRRWADIRRWGDAPALLESQLNVDIKNRGVDAKMKSFGPGIRARYEATKGFFPIPETQIGLSEGVLVQNPGWGTPDALYQGW